MLTDIHGKWENLLDNYDDSSVINCHIRMCLCSIRTLSWLGWATLSIRNSLIHITDFYGVSVYFVAGSIWSPGIYIINGSLPQTPFSQRALILEMQESLYGTFLF